MLFVHVTNAVFKDMGMTGHRTKRMSKILNIQLILTVTECLLNVGTGDLKLNSLTSEIYIVPREKCEPWWGQAAANKI